MKKELLHKLLALNIDLKNVNGDLKLKAPKGALTKSLVAEIKEHKAYLLKLLESNNDIPKAVEASDYALSPTQYSLWFIHEHLGGDKAYNLMATLKIEGNLDTLILQKAFERLVNKHESLRTQFIKAGNGNVRQRIIPIEDVHFELYVEDFTENQELLHQRLNERHQSIFNLERDLLINASVFKTDVQTHILHFMMHHIISDGWSLQVFTKEIMAEYSGLILGETGRVEKSNLQYKDYSEWLNAQLESESYDKKLNFWKKQFETFSSSLTLNSTERPAERTYNGTLIHHNFSPEFTQHLDSFAKKHQMTLFMLLLGGLNGVFSKYSNQYDITLGTTVAGREHPDLEDQIGLYSNALAIRTKFEKEQTFLEFLTTQKQTLLQTYENKEYPFTKLLNHLSIPTNNSRSPLFDIMVLLQNHQTVDVNNQNEIANLSISEYDEIEKGVSQLDISFVFIEGEENLTLSVEYNTDIYTSEFISRLVKYFELFLSKGIEEPETTLENIKLIDAGEEHIIYNIFNQKNIPLTHSKTVVEYIGENAVRYPNYKALIGTNENITYLEFDEISCQIANYLEKVEQIQKGDFVGIILDGSPRTIMTILGVMKTGATYIPIDPTYPKARKEYIKTVSNCKIFIDESMLNTINEEIKDHSKKYISKAEQGDAAYVIFTSGSTGKPKGIPITHASLIDYATSFSDYFKITDRDSILQQASISFDTSIEEIYPILIGGGTLIFHKEKADFNALYKLCEKHRVTLLSTNPYALQYLNQYYHDFNLNLRALISGGDVLRMDYIDSIYQQIPIYNTYGPTESTVCATYYKVIGNENIIPIGKPIKNRQVYVVAADSTHLMPIDIAGELCISGLGLSEGYLGNEILTKEKFIEHPFIKGETLYRTGDLAKWLPDGNLLFMGRKDSQVKIRGYRIELEEIENTLMQFSDGIIQVVLHVKESRNIKELVAYYVSNSKIEIAELRDFLQEKLPSYMVPSYYVELEKIPLTTNGKIDKKSLPEITSRNFIQKEYLAPRNETESTLVAIWEEVLGVEAIGITDNFFELGGHSLLIGQIVNRIHKQLNKSITFASFFVSPTIKGISKELSNIVYNGIPQATAKPYYPLTTSQQRIWVLSQLEGGNLAYNIPAAVTLKGGLDISKFHETFKILIKRHEILRTNFRADDSGEIHQYINQEESAEFSFLEKNVINKTKEEIDFLLQEEHATAFDLEKGALLRTALYKRADKEHIFSLTMHHIISDGWSMELLIAEIISIYNNCVQNKENNLPKLEIQYKDYAVWLQSELSKDRYMKSEAYWLTQFQGELPILDLPSFKNRPKIQTYNGKTLSHRYSVSFLEKLKSLSSSKDATLFMTLMAGINALLYRYTNQNDIIIGTPMAGREHPDLEGQIGLYLNTLAIRTTIEGSNNFLELLELQKQTLLSAYEHQDYPFDELVSKLNIKRDISRSTLFDVMVILHNQSQLNSINSGSNLDDLEVEGYVVNQTTSKFDLSFSFVVQEELELRIEYNTDIYDDLLIERMFAHFENLMSQAIANLDDTISSIEYITGIEKRQLLENFNNTTVEYPKDKTIIDLFEAQERKIPNKVAVVFEDSQLTFKELNEKSNQLAQYLREEFTILPDDLIGIKLKRSEHLLVTILGVLKSGAAYVPIDINYPQERINYIEKDSNCKAILDEDTLEKFSSSKEKYSIENLQNIPSPSHLAYVIYTSGTTGNPKGVMIMHSNLMAMINWACSEFDADQYNIVYAATSHCFDLSIYEMFYPLIMGKKIKIFENALAIGEELQRDENVLVNTVPSSLRNLIDSGFSLDNAAYINLAGEPFPLDIAKRLLTTNAEIRNLYGPSEDTTYSTTYKLSSEVDYTTSIPIGKPISNTKVYILDGHLEPKPIGVVGDLYVAGAGITKGYLNKEELTAERFIANPFIEGEVMYHTGDMAKWLIDGNIEFVGRKDSQVKIRGYRIELEEIENVLIQYSDDMIQVVLDVKQSRNENELVAYYVSKSKFENSELKGFLQERMPSFMIPNYYVELDKIPLTPNGKVDKKSLPEISSEALIQQVYEAPRNEIERQLAIIWQDVLGIDKIGITDNFFSLGGHSLLVGQIVNRINKRLNKSITFASFFVSPTIKEISKTLSTNIYNEIPHAVSKPYYPLTTSQRRIYVLSQFEGGSLAYNMPVSITIRGYLDVLKFGEVFNKLINRHEILRTNFKEDESGDIHQYITQEGTIEFDLRERDFRDQTREEIKQIIEVENTKKFNLADGLLIRASLFRTGVDEHLFSLNMHHIISDGWSLELLISEVVSTYNNLVQKKESNLPKLGIQYKDYAVWLQSELNNDHYKAAEIFWISQFEGELPILDLPSFKNRPKRRTYQGSTLSNRFSVSFLEKLKRFSASKEVTLFMTLMAGINSMLFRLTNQNDIIVGTPIAGREHPELERQIGLYLNTLAIRTKIDNSHSFLDVLEQQKQVLLLAYQHQNYPFDELVNKLNLKRDTSRSALFDVMVILQNQTQLHNIETDKTLDGIGVEGFKVENTNSKFDITFTFSEVEGLDLSIEYNTDNYDEFLIARMFAHFENLICLAIDSPDDTILSLEYITVQERKQLLEEFNDTELDAPISKTIVDLFEKQVEKTPNSIAVEFEGKHLTYNELNEQSNQLGQYLREHYRIESNDMIGIKMDRSEQLFVSILGVLKSGAAYVPIDINYPEERINYIEKDSNCKVVIDEEELEQFRGIKDHYSVENIPNINGPDDLAYVIYTSGTTGNPKGVMIMHHNTVEMLNWAQLEFDEERFDLVYATTSQCFDISIYEIFYPLSIGKKVKLLENALSIGDELQLDENVLINTVPSSIRYLVDSGISLDNATVINLAGEPFPIDLAKKLLSKNADIRNLYGPSEDTTYSTSYLLSSDVNYSTSIPIGKPISNTSTYILDSNLNPVPIGTTGNLYVSGSGVAKGYLNKPILTDERFISNPFIEGSRMYDTGDLAKWMPDGNIAFQGRKDNQVKIRGYRIELEEIENTIILYSKDIQQVVLHVKEVEKEKDLIAYYVCNSEIDKSDLRSFLETRLPSYMVPRYYLSVDSIPLTANGKIDKKSLPEVISGDLIKKEYVAPTNDIEIRMVEIWQDVLGVDRIGIMDNFFDLGGHSLHLVKITNILGKEYGNIITIDNLFMANNIKELSSMIDFIINQKDDNEVDENLEEIRL